MAVTYVGDCPHCLAETVGMTLAGYTQLPAQRPTAMFQCNRCYDILCICMETGRVAVDWLSHESGPLEDAMESNYARIISIYPAPERTDAPKHTSSVVRRAYEQGIDNAKRKNMDAAAAMYRKALDVATRELDAALAGKNLAPRIDALHKSGRLTDDLKEWAHLIRLDGNHGAHDDDELSMEEISQLASFTELFLTYTFTLPAQVAARKAAAASSE
ncbi:hypothetical protein B9Y72_11330 [Stenotrophomonas maltophilia]|nr:hypothetical protein B9Y68_11330 [Stenotrophomonas maltophilia]PJL22353.1 hypothetical protein B9Y72_11330 [Stenotrophomonas maltophilia]